MRPLLLNLAFLIAAAILVLPSIGLAANPSSANYQVQGPVITNGGGQASSASFSLLSVIGELVHSFANSASYSTLPGFAGFPYVSTPSVSTTAGDTNVALTWSAAVPFLGYTVSGYSVGQSAASGGPYAFTSVGNVLAYTAANLSNGTPYYFVLRVLDANGIVIGTSTEVTGTPVAPATPPPPPPPPGGGGPAGGGSPGPNPSPRGTAGVEVSGLAYPGSTVVLLKDGQVALSSIAGGDAHFDFSLTGLPAGSYVFSVYGIDSKGNKSVPLPFPTMLTDGATTVISGIFLAPTIDVDKSMVKKGDNITIFGQGASLSNVVISVHSNPELFVSTKTDKAGGYLYVFDSSPLDYGDHLTKSKTMQNNLASNFSNTVGFAVGDSSVVKSATDHTCIIGDLNCDGHVNLVDFSIMAFWFNRPLTGTGTKADLNHDNKVNLVDFSIMVYHWTG